MITKNLFFVINGFYFRQNKNCFNFTIFFFFYVVYSLSGKSARALLTYSFSCGKSISGRWHVKITVL